MVTSIHVYLKQTLVSFGCLVYLKDYFMNLFWMYIPSMAICAWKVCPNLLSQGFIAVCPPSASLLTQLWKASTGKKISQQWKLQLVSFWSGGRQTSAWSFSLGNKAKLSQTRVARHLMGIFSRFVSPAKWGIISCTICIYLRDSVIIIEHARPRVLILTGSQLLPNLAVLYLDWKGGLSFDELMNQLSQGQIFMMALECHCNWFIGIFVESVNIYGQQKFIVYTWDILSQKFLRNN